MNDPLRCDCTACCQVRLAKLVGRIFLLLILLASASTLIWEIK